MTSAQYPLVSVVVPIYNMQNFLAETIDSVLKSSYPNFEVMLIDDGSKDNSASIARDYAQKDARVRFYSQVNGGASKARNFGISQSGGKYILPVDADNLISADYIEKCVIVLETRADVKVVTCEAEFFGDKTGQWKLPPFSLKLLARKNLMDNCAMYRKSDWEHVGGYCDEILGREDWDFWISMLKSGGEVVRLPITGLYYRVRSDSKRKRTRHLKSELISQLNSRHKAFFYKQLGGPLHKSRTWSELYNKLVHVIKPEKVKATPDFEDFVYNIPEVFISTENKLCSRIFDLEKGRVEVSRFKSQFCFAKSKARKAYEVCDVESRIGYYEKRTVWGSCESYFVKRITNSAPAASIIVAVYKNTDFLKYVLDSLSNQSEMNFEIIITEDGNSLEMKQFVDNYNFKHRYIHLTQDDQGWRKNKALNAAVRASKSGWLIFVDGDCVLHPRFVEMHLRYASNKVVLAGKRVKLGSAITSQFLAGELNVEHLQKKILKGFLLNKSENKFSEEGVFISPDGMLGFVSGMRKLNYLKGCNMSFSKEAIWAINGFDEDYVLPAIGEDIDLSWRFEMAGYKHRSVRNLAVQYHLHHKENWVSQLENANIMREKKERNEYICKNGLEKK